MATAAMRPNAELTLVLRIRTKEIVQSQGKFMPIEKQLPYCKKTNVKKLSLKLF